VISDSAGNAVDLSEFFQAEEEGAPEEGMPTSQGRPAADDPTAVTVPVFDL
jgi:hypothetical protein